MPQTEMSSVSDEKSQINLRHFGTKFIIKQNCLSINSETVCRWLLWCIWIFYY